MSARIEPALTVTAAGDPLPGYFTLTQGEATIAVTVDPFTGRPLAVSDAGATIRARGLE